MRYAILLQRRADGSFQASVPAMAGLTQVANTRDEVLTAIRQAIMAALETSEFVFVDVPQTLQTEQNPWLATAGLFADDPSLEPMLQDIYAARESE